LYRVALAVGPTKIFATGGQTMFMVKCGVSWLLKPLPITVITVFPLFFFLLFLFSPLILKDENIGVVD
jgi:uncharacterized membrane protein YukC